MSKIQNQINYGRQWIDESDIEAVVEALRSDFLTQGPKVAEFEEALCEKTGAKYCVAVANGTAALHLAVAALELPPDSEGITSPITFTATSNSLIYNNLHPRFADIDTTTGLIDPQEIKAQITGKTAVIMPVHYAGQACDMAAIKQIADDRKLHVIEDAAHAIGSRYPSGDAVGSCKYSDMTTFSFHPVKTMTTGEGGAITTNNKDLYEKLMMLRSHGITKDPDRLERNDGPWYYEMHELGYNYRITDIQCALGISQLRKLDMFIDRRREIAAMYDAAFAGMEWLRPLREMPGNHSAWHLYVLKIDYDKIGKSRSEVMEILRERKIGTQVHYIPVHQQPYYKKNFGYEAGNYPRAEKFYQQILSIPLFPAMVKEEVDYVIEAIRELK
jgi:UDP-4-amino-4,6-dideoxy-N-acetyl-beta-L-altrosamine transaminase